jgi:hypothetical protein
MITAPAAATRFRDARLDESFERDGYVVVDFLDAPVIRHLLDLFHSQDVEVHRQAFGSSLQSNDLAYRALVDAEVRAAFAEPLKRWVEGYRVCFGNYTLKQPKNEIGEMPFHQDPTFVDEERFQTIGIWCPLVDVTLENGCLCVVPGSHKLNRGPRGPFTNFPYEDLVPLIREKYLRPVPMKAGQAFLFCQKIFHTSPPNRADELRVVATALTAPRESRLLFYHQRPANRARIEIYEVDDAFYTRHILGTEPAGVSSIREIDYYYEPLTEARLRG